MLTPNLFQVNVRLEKTGEDGTVRKVTEQYLFDAMSHTEAESRAIEEIAPFSNGDLEITKVQKTHIEETFLSDLEGHDSFWLIKVAFITLDEKTQAEKATTSRFLMQYEDDIFTAVQNFKELMKGTMLDFRVLDFKLTKYMDFFKHKEEKEEEE